MKFSVKYLVICFICTVLLFSNQGYTQGNDNKIDIVWIGHSCFEIRFLEFRILIDPFSPESFDHILPQIKYDIAFATHKAQDHFYFEGIEADTYLLACGDKNEFISERQDEKLIIKGKSTLKTPAGAFSYWTVASFHDDQQGALEGVNGIICLDFNGIKVVHLGDLGHVLNKKKLEQIGRVDVLMIPVDGYFTIDVDTAKIIISQLSPRIIFPMHYRTGKSKTKRPVYTEDDITAGFENIKKLDQSHLVIDSGILNKEQQIIILDYMKLRDFPVLKGPYLGQKPPGNTPELFPTRISSDLEIDSIPLFAENGRSLIFKGRRTQDSAVYFTEEKNGTWSKPRKMFPLSPYEDRHFFLVPSGGRIFFTSRRPLQPGGKETEDPNIWMIEVNNSKWGLPHPLPPPINTPNPEFYTSVSLPGTLYFSGYSEDSNCDILYSPLENGKYTEIRNPGPAINTEYVDGDPYVPPDESYLIFLSDRPGGFGQHDFYISFHKADGSWTEPVHLEKNINSEANDVCPLVSPDGRFFFFSSNRTGRYEIYWVDAQFINNLKPDKREQ